MVKNNGQKRMVKKKCPYGFPGIYIYMRNPSGVVDNYSERNEM